MPTIERIVTNLPLQPHHKAALESAAAGAHVVYVAPGDKAALGEALAGATVAVLSALPDIAALKTIQWLHWDAAGLDGVASPAFLETGLIITGSAGRSAPALAEHALYFMLNHAYHHREVLTAQAAHRWGYPGQSEMRALFSQTIGIIGMGNTGRALAVRAKALEMRVIGYSRKAYDLPDVDLILSEENGDSLDTLLRESDYIVMCAALTDRTYRMIGERELSLMRPTAFLVNLGRGKTIDEAALLAALREGRLGGAGLDTFETEPLPTDSPVWDTPNLQVTPHFTPACPDKLGRSLAIVLDNIERFRRGEPLLNRLTPGDLYSK